MDILRSFSIESSLESSSPINVSSAAEVQALCADVVQQFKKLVASNPDTAIAVCAIQALTGLVRRSNATTLMELEVQLKAATDCLKATHPASISLAAGCTLYQRYVTRTGLDTPSLSECVARILKRGEAFSRMSINARQKINDLVDRFISNGKQILTHGYSRVVIAALIHAARQGKAFRVVVTEGRPNNDGIAAAKELLNAGIPVKLVLDAAVGYILEEVDFVFVGAEAVTENGGIVTLCGAYQIAMVSHYLAKPFYVATESYKFARLYPLNQRDLPDKRKDVNSFPGCDIEPSDDFTFESPILDYTPPNLISLLFTDLGILSPSAVSDELIKTYS